MAEVVEGGGGEGITCDFSCLHVRLLVEGALVRGYFNICLLGLVKVSRPVAVPEERDVAKLLRLTAGKDAHAILDHVLSAGSLDEGRRHQVLGWQLEVAVVLEHSSELEVLWITFSVKGGEVLVLKCFRDLNHAVRPGEGRDRRKKR